MEPRINILLTSFGGLDLPRTLTFPVSSDITVSDLATTLSERIPQLSTTRLILTTNSNKQILTSSNEPIASLLSSPEDAFLPVRLSAPLCGGKGGFGSILRAAGGRMSSRKKRNQGESNGSSRNLDGRRLRTVTEAKALAEYLTIKPEMEKKEKEERRKRWEEVVALSDKREEEIRNGKNTRLDGKWVEDKEEAEQKTRDAIIASFKAGGIKNAIAEVSKESDSSGVRSEGSEDSDSEGIIEAAPSSSKAKATAQPRAFHGWDEDDEFMSDSEEEEETVEADTKGKGKAKA